MKPDLDKFPRWTTYKLDGVFTPQTTFLMQSLQNGGWYDSEEDVVCIFGNMEWHKLLFAVDHEVLHRIIHGFVGLEPSRWMDNLYLFDLMGINSYGEVSDVTPDSVFDWKIRKTFGVDIVE